MRSDHLKRHEKTHKDIDGLSDAQIKEELHIRQAAYIQREERREHVRELARAEGIPIERCSEIVRWSLHLWRS